MLDTGVGSSICKVTEPGSKGKVPHTLATSSLHDCCLFCLAFRRSKLSLLGISCLTVCVPCLVVIVVVVMLHLLSVQHRPVVMHEHNW